MQGTSTMVEVSAGGQVSGCKLPASHCLPHHLYAACSLLPSPSSACPPLPDLPCAPLLNDPLLPPNTYPSMCSLTASHTVYPPTVCSITIPRITSACSSGGGREGGWKEDDMLNCLFSMVCFVGFSVR